MKATSLLLTVFTLPALALATDETAMHQQFFATYCIECHGAQTQKGDVRFDDLSAIDPNLWKNVYEQIASDSMPPSNRRQPSKAGRDSMMKYALELAIEDSSVTSTGFRRLNKREYGNTVRDLLGLKKGTFDPAEYVYDDEIDEGFDTLAESLVISNELLLEYMGAAKKSLRQALFSAANQRPKHRLVDVNLRKAKGTSQRYINHHRDYVICRSGGKARIHDGLATRTMQFPGRYSITITAAGVDRDAYPVRFQPLKGPLIMGFGIAQDATESVSDAGKTLRTFELKDDVERTFTIETWIDKGHFPYLSFVNGSSKPITQVRANIRRRKLKPSAMKKPYVGPGIKISQLRIEGPFYDQWPPESFRTTYDSADMPDLTNEAQREQVILRFATRAFRRHVTRDEVASYIAFLDQQHAATGDWHESIIRTFAAMMSSIDFLYIREDQGELNSYELANRLSYFFWSTMPDDELMGLAESGKLAANVGKNSGVRSLLQSSTKLQEQVSRMLNDPRSNRFSTSFVNQWLALDKLGSMPPDAKGEFRVYYRQNLESAMLEETRRFFSYVLRENRSVRDFIDSNYSFLNKPLAELYGVPFAGDAASGFERITFGSNTMRGGLLLHASILTLSANGVETSPIERGVWVLTNLLGTPPPPPPKEVPALTPDLNGAVTVRQMLEKHRSDPACMECHRRMDPLGFALEAYDPIGRFRTKYSKTQTVSTHGNYLGQDFADVTELKKILSHDIRPFVRNLIVRIAEYAKGRRLHAADYATVEVILDQTAKTDFRLKDILFEIATGDLMTHR